MHPQEEACEFRPFSRGRARRHPLRAKRRRQEGRLWQLNEATSAYGAKPGEHELQGWHQLAFALQGKTSTPVPFTGGAFSFAGRAYGGQAYYPEGRAGQNRTPDTGKETGEPANYGPTYANAGRGAGYHRGRGAFDRGGRGGRSLNPCAVVAPARGWRPTIRTPHM